jgi:tryptophan 2,3-dioxygenase
MRSIFLEKMSPWDYQQARRAPGHGSVFDSPGFNLLRRVIPGLGAKSHRLLASYQLDLLELLLNDRDHEDLYQLAEWLLELDESVSLWRSRHFKVVEKSIGMKAEGTQGALVEVLGRLNGFSFFPELWEIRSYIMTYAMKEESSL